MFKIRRYTGTPHSPSKVQHNKNKTTKDSDPVEMNLEKVPHKVSPCKEPHPAKVEADYNGLQQLCFILLSHFFL